MKEVLESSIMYVFKLWMSTLSIPFQKQSGIYPLPCMIFAVTVIIP
jgi:hypothetical protein